MAGTEVAYCWAGTGADGDLMGKSEMVHMGLLQGDGPTEERLEEG